MRNASPTRTFAQLEQIKEFHRSGETCVKSTHILNQSQAKNRLMRSRNEVQHEVYIGGNQTNSARRVAESSTMQEDSSISIIFRTIIENPFHRSFEYPVHQIAS